MRMLVRRSLGVTRVAAHLARGAVTLAVVMPFAGPARRRRIVQRWSEGVLRIFGLALDVHGAPPDAGRQRPVVLVGNHISWIDIYAYLCVADVQFVAKSEVQSWPLIGWFARSLGTIFVERDRPRDALRVGDEIRAALAAGKAVCVFPEGTTTDGSVVLPFSAALLGPAVEANAHVLPVSITYRNAAGEPCQRVAFTGDATLVESIWTLAAGEKTRVQLRFLDAIEAGGLDRRTVARRSEESVRASLGHPPPPIHRRRPGVSPRNETEVPLAIRGAL
ncbi:MAG: lysophospholipid acyltransferase family protein [Hyphomicrobiaceae bacterium]|nr:lysophospholipid acyltransferase family protein [Hyphomicrobiaceae bacterium]